MAQIDEGDDGLSIHDLIKTTEDAAESFDSFLEQKGKEWSNTSAAGAVSDSTPLSNDQGGTESSLSPDAPTADTRKQIPPQTESQKLLLDKYPGLTKSENHDQPIPEPVVPEPPPTTVPPIVPDFTEVTTIHNHPLLGTYSSTEQVMVETDEELDQIFRNGFHKGVNEMTPDQVLFTIHQIRRQITRSKRAEQSLVSALEVHLGQMNDADKAALQIKDRQYRSTRKVKEPGEKKAPKISKSGKSPIEKSVLAYKDMGSTEEECVQAITERGKMTPEVRAFISRAYQGVV